MKQQVQKFGRFLSGMVLPNISALIAWGFFTAIFLQGGWFPNEKMAAVISPMLNYLIPVLMGYTEERWCTEQEEQSSVQWQPSASSSEAPSRCSSEQ